MRVLRRYSIALVNRHGPGQMASQRSDHRRHAQCDSQSADISINSLAGITGGMSVALAAMAGSFIGNAQAAGIPLEVFHRVASMASGGMDTLPHNGTVITLLAGSGLTHRQSYKDIFAVTMIKTAALFVIIGVYYATGIV
jgi:H+/gluconate symporter-like permease